ncbi:exoglucanase B-like [Cylas formicarius]|uniref:exoglucanase B-like n=1 Tax=Cylas formicarius TaxID=197179 RepID=UPI0029589277|nr:exoglucanase B-like [Cylas formicarius]
MKFLAILILSLCVACIKCGVYTDRFLEQYAKIHNASNKYFSKEGVPYHNLETLQVESTDYGHETDSEAYSYYIWLEAMYGAIQGDFSSFNKAWETMETYQIPTLQPNGNLYNPSNPGAGYGIDPVGDELRNTYGTSDLYLMHWLSDVDNVYGFGNTNGQCELGPSANAPSFVNNGPGSVFQGITYPTCDNFVYGGQYGFQWYGSTVPSWQYSVAPDAEARAIQAAYWASQWAGAKGQISQISNTLSKASKLGDFLRYAFFDKHFLKVGYCESNCQPGTGKESAHYLLSWYIGFGGALSTQGGYSWRMGSSEAHSGYQNPMTAYALLNDPNLKPKSASAQQDWQNSLQRQLALYQFVQSPSGAFAGGVTNSWNDNYGTPPSEISSNSFNGMWYKEQPGYDTASNWYGMQSWSADRLAQYYYLTGDAAAKSVIDKWVSWILANTRFESDSFYIPQSLSYSGSPPNVQVTVSNYGRSIGLASSTARTLAYYAAKSGNAQAKSVAKQLLDGIYNLYRTEKGAAISEQRSDYNQFNTNVYIPVAGWSGRYPNGDYIDASSTFQSIRSWYKNDPDYYKVQQYLNGGAIPAFDYHRFWEQADFALAQGAYGLLFNE